MAVTETSICNSALIKIGVERITALSEDSKAGRACNEQYEKLRDEVLASHPWNFAIARAEIAEVDADLAFGYDYIYQLPSDCLRVLEMDPDYEYKIEENRYLVTDTSGDVHIRYIKKITDTSKFSPVFCEALALRIASELAYYMTNSATLAESMMKAFEKKIAEARSFDAQEGTPDRIIADEWLNSRY